MCFNNFFLFLELNNKKKNLLVILYLKFVRFVFLLYTLQSKSSHVWNEQNQQEHDKLLVEVIRLYYQ
jgi:hypothetical protein